MPPEDKDAIEHRKRELYSRTAKADSLGDIRTPLSPHQSDAPVTWARGEADAKKEEKPKGPPLAPFAPKRTMSLPAKFLIGSVAFFVIAAVIAVYIFLGGGNLVSPNNIDLQIVTPSLVDAGKEATFEVLIDNRNASPLTLSTLTINYPGGTRDPNNPDNSLTQGQQTIGTIEPGQELKETVSGVYYGAEGTQEQIGASLTYSVPGSNAVFQKQSTTAFTIGSTPVSLAVNAPQMAINNQSFPISVTVENNTTAPIQNVVVQGNYPFGYTPSSSDPPALPGGAFWQLGTLAPGASETIQLMGVLNGSNGDSRVFSFQVGSNTDPTDTSVEVPLITVPATVTLQAPFIQGTIAVNGQTGNSVSVQGGAPINGTITWQNNLSTTLSDVQMTLTLSGPALDPSSISAGSGFYQSQNSSITWTPTQEPSLASVPPGGTGTLSFSFAALPPGSGNTLVTNPVINLSLAITGTNEASSTQEQVSSAAQTSVTVGSTVFLSEEALHFSGPLPGSGPMPPTVGSNTSYTIMWTVKNSSNDVGNATVSTVLPPYVQFLSAGASNGISYDPTNNTVTWDIGDLPSGVGYSSPAMQGYFQVLFTPSSSQVGTAPTLTGNAELQGQDRFAQVPVSATASGPTTNLENDSGFQNTMGAVVQ